jgi:hypothetical protein
VGRDEALARRAHAMLAFRPTWMRRIQENLADGYAMDRDVHRAVLYDSPETIIRIVELAPEWKESESTEEALVAAAWALGRYSEMPEAREALTQLAESGNSHARLMAAHVLSEIDAN